MIQEVAHAVDANAEGIAAGAAEAAHGAAAGGHGLGEQISHNIIHHISNGNSIEVPFLGDVELPHLQLLGVDMSITKHVVMMWIAGLFLLFFFILTCNLLGLVPYGSTATGNINVTGALALCTLVMIQLEGVRRHGLVKHLKHMIPGGLPIYMFPVAILIFVIELFGFVVI